jgi:hypothetical protein
MNAPTWTAVGMVMEKRELKSSKPTATAWRGYVAKIACLGLTLEVDLSADLYGVIAEGTAVEAHGLLVEQQGVVKFKLTTIKPLAKEKAA